jgi:ribonucleoside-diphosphate reductase alpha chain
MTDALLYEPVADYVWRLRYRLSENGHVHEPSIQATWSRVALALSGPELHQRDVWYERFRAALSDFRFLPAGRILAGAGSQRRNTLFNCFVSGALRDSVDAIFSTLGEAMITLQEGGGIGCDFSPLRPAGMLARETGNIASGPVSFLPVWNQACAALASTGVRRGAMMATLRCDHPDIEAFIDAKREPGVLQYFNLSVLVSDAFLRAVERDELWPLVFPMDGRPVPPDAMICERIWSGSITPEPCVASKTVAARELWRKLRAASIDFGDPGVIFIDRVESSNNLWYAETISATNPCGEVPLPPHGACNLGSINLTQFIEHPFGAHPKIDFKAIAGTTAVAVRMLDNVIDISHFPLNAQRKSARGSRRIGLGVTGLADALIMLGLRYDAEAAQDVAAAVMQTICHAAYQTSIDLVPERGLFPQYRAAKYLESGFARSLPPRLRDAIQHKGIHNSHLTAIAPAGSISLLANHVSSGVEPVQAFHAHRSFREMDGIETRVPVHDYAWTLFRTMFGEKTPLPPCFVEAHDIDPVDQLKLQAALQVHVDQSISKTVQLPADADIDRYGHVFDLAYQLGLKGCTVFRAGSERGSALNTSDTQQAPDACP